MSNRKLRSSKTNLNLFEMVNIACIGAGYWGKNLIRNFNSLGHLKTICDGNQQTLASFSEQYPNCNTSGSIDSVLDDSSIHAVSIATPAETHAKLIEKALMAGKHVYVEKPLCLDETEGETLIHLAKERNLVLMVGHLLQYHPAYLEIKRMVENDELGDLRYIYSNRLNMGLLRKEENALWSFAPHDISMILGLVGSMPQSVSAVGSTYLTKNIADITVGNMSFKNNVNAHIFISWLNPFKEQKLTVIGSDAMIVFDDTLPWSDKITRYDHLVKWSDDHHPQAIKKDGLAINLDEAEPLKNECQHFIQSVTNNTAPRTNGDEGLRVLKVLNQLQKSMS